MAKALEPEFSKLAAAVLHSPYFDFTTSDRLEELWAEREVLANALHEGANSIEELPRDAREVWDRAYDSMVREDQPEPREGEDPEAYDLRARLTEPLPIRRHDPEANEAGE